MSLGPAGASLDPEQAENFEDMEKQFAVKGTLPTTVPRSFELALLPHMPALDTALVQNSQLTWGIYTTIAVQHMTTYWAILEKMRGSKLRLTKIDDEIYDHFKKDFPEFDTRATINEDKMKSKEGKERWRKFIMAYEKRIDDYNFGTMLRANPSFEYGEKETIFAMRMQFYAVEIARNREGLNDWIYEREHSEEKKGSS